MFSAKENECVGFKSSWKVKRLQNKQEEQVYLFYRVYTNGSSQTSGYDREERGTNTQATTDAEIQTFEEASTISSFTANNVDLEKLSKWLKDIYPSVSEELTEAFNSRAFSQLLDDLELDEDPESKLVQTLEIFSNIGSGEKPLNVNAFSWNCTGNSIAVTSNAYHENWCHHVGCASFYTFNRNDQFPDTPHMKLSTSSCITVLRFHPVISFVLACGTHSGEVIIWNIQQNDGNNVVCKGTNHKDAVTEISWIKSVEVTQSILLATSSLDGLLIVWNFNLTSGTLTPKQSFCIKSPIFSKTKRKAPISESIAKKVLRGILAFDFSSHVPNIFVIGTEGGLVIQCNTLGAQPLKGSSNELQLSDPIFKYHEPHEGEIQTVQFSPNQKEMFLSFASDGQIRIYLLEQDAPAQVIFPETSLYGVAWVPQEEKLVAGCGIKGMIEVFNVVKGRDIPNSCVGNIVPTDLMQIAINTKRCTTVAVGNNKGELQLWKVPWSVYAKTNLTNT